MDRQEKAARNDAMRMRVRAASKRVVQLFRQLPREEEARIAGRQVVRSSSSLCINYRAVCRARSEAEFIAKLSICVEEGDETSGWLELIGDWELVALSRLEPLMKEYNELVAQLATARRTAIERREARRKPPNTQPQTTQP